MINRSSRPDPEVAIIRIVVESGRALPEDFVGIFEIFEERLLKQVFEPWLYGGHPGFSSSFSGSADATNPTEIPTKGSEKDITACSPVLVVNMASLRGGK